MLGSFQPRNVNCCTYILGIYEHLDKILDVLRFKACLVAYSASTILINRNYSGALATDR